MFFKKKKMVDLRDLPHRSPSLPQGRVFAAKEGYGFVDLTRKQKLPSEIAKEKALLGETDTKSDQGQPASSFNFFDAPTPNYPTQTSSETSSDNEELLRKISTQISDLDTKIYKLEQRIEVVERKSGISNSSSSDSGFGW